MRVFDPAKISIMFAGRLLQGWADGDFVSISNTTDAFVSVAGTDGEVTRVKTNDRRATVTVTTMQSSPVNDMLSAIHTLDILTPNGQGVGPLNIADCNGTSLYAAEQAWIVKAPDATFGKEAKSREWRIECANLRRIDGSNLQPVTSPQ